MKKHVLLMCVLACLCCSCVSTVPVLIRRGVVGDDWVYVKEENKLYKRYIPRGIMLIGNEKLKTFGSVTHANERIVIYGSYEKAAASCQFVVDADSARYVPSPTNQSSSVSEQGEN